MELQTPLRFVPGIGPTIAKRLQKLNLETVEDLINHYPFRYEDFSNLSTIPTLKEGEMVTLKGQVWSISNTYTRFKKVLTKAVFNDGTGSIDLVWFNQSWLTKTLTTGDWIQLSGKVSQKGRKFSIMMPQWEKISGDSESIEVSNHLHTGRLVPVYPETYGITSKWVRAKIADILPKVKAQIHDPLPEQILKHRLPLIQALDQIHFPEDFKSADQAKDRLAFDEMFYLNLTSTLRRQQWQKQSLHLPIKIRPKDLDQFITGLQFELTEAQKRVIAEIVSDLTRSNPMNRLVQGDVGSGKTVVAATIIYLIYLNNLKSLYMAPTEILAFQHYQTLTKLLGPYGIKVGIYTGSRKFTKLDKSSDQEPDVVVGTHALLSKQLNVSNVGLVVIDEQQRFGVEQRSLLRQKASQTSQDGKPILPHFLTMTATPIPRTVALTLYGDLDLSIIDQLPKGRKLVKTHFVPKKKREDAYKFIAEEVKKGFQIYIITPFIEPSETDESAKAAKVEYERLKSEIFPDLRLGLLHGRLKSKDKEQVLADFKDHKIDLLVSTSVVEVGVDVPNATIMVIEGAQRFGLAQLHQLRGRVGRGEAQSYTFLFTEDEAPPIVNRLKNLETIHDGLKLSELDLKIRGSGELFGLRQSGEWNLKIASLADLPLIEETRAAVHQILQGSPNLDKYPALLGKLTTLSAAVMPD